MSRSGSYPLLALAASLAFGQGGNGTITGTVTDSTGAVVATTAVEAKNTQTGLVYTAASSNAGVYSISNLPVGVYAVTARAQGFKTYTHTNLALAATQVLREDITLEVGAAAESVTVTAEATLLATQTGELTHNITLQQMDDLPLLGIGTTNAGATAIRNPFNAIEALPPLSPTLNFLPSEETRLPGVSLYNVDINNIHGYNPGTQQVLNPNAWAQCPVNATCPAAYSGATGPAATVYYSDFRGPRAPVENANFGRNFRVKERLNLFIRAEFVNIFNRTILPNPISSGATVNPQNPVTKTAGANSSGFGVINTFATPGSQPSTATPPYLTGRTGTLIARFTF